MEECKRRDIQVKQLQAELSKLREANTTYLKAILSSEPEKTVKLVTEIERLKEFIFRRAWDDLSHKLQLTAKKLFQEKDNEG
jgi:hypothetical protein